MNIYLVQHGKAFSREIDPERFLTPEGGEETITTANLFKQRDLKISEIMHSSKNRAAETAEIFSEILGTDIPKSRAENLNPDDDVSITAAWLAERDNLMIIGHLPFLSRLASFLVYGNTDSPVTRFRNSGIVCLESDGDSWKLKWTINP